MPAVTQLQQPIAFYNDRNKHDHDYRLTQILYRDNDLCLCKATPMVRPDSPLAREMATVEASRQAMALAGTTESSPWWRMDEETILFNHRTGEVLTANLYNWRATNDMTVFGRHPAAACA